MKTLFAAADDLSKRGFGPTTEIVDRLAEAMRKGRLTEFPKYGIAIDTTKSKSDQLAQAMESLKNIADNPLVSDAALDSLDQMKVKAKDAADSIKTILGNAFNEALIFIAKDLDRLDKMVDRHLGGIARGRGVKLADVADVRASADLEARARAAKGLLSPDPTDAEISAEADRLFKLKLAATRELIKNSKIKQELADAEIEKDIAIAEAMGPKITDQFNKKKPVTREKRLGAYVVSMPNGRPLAMSERDFFEGIEFGQSGFESLAVLGSDKAPEAPRNKIKERDEARKAFESAMKAHQDSAQAAGSAASSTADIMQSLFGKNKALERANAVIQSSKNIAMAATEFALGNIPGGLAFLAAAAKWGVVATKAGGSASTGGLSVPGGAFRTTGGFGGGAGGRNITVNVGGGFVGKPKELGKEISESIRTAERAGRIRESRATRFRG